MIGLHLGCTERLRGDLLPPVQSTANAPSQKKSQHPDSNRGPTDYKSEETLQRYQPILINTGSIAPIVCKSY